MGEGRGSPTSKPSAGTILILDSSKTNTAIFLEDCAYSGVRNLVVYRKGKASVAEKRRKDPAGDYEPYFKCRAQKEKPEPPDCI